MDRAASFDRALIAGPFVLAAAAAAAVVAQPSLFAVLFVVDLWLLAFPHVIATFTRVAFDSESFRRHRFLAVGLLPLIGVAVGAIVWWKGYEPIITVYFYWQWFHYMRQSHGLERILWRKAAGISADAAASRGLVHSVALCGLLNRCHQAQPSFLGMKVWWLPVPGWIVTLAAAISLVAVIAWLWSTWTAGTRHAHHTAYVLTHVAVFVLAYGIVPDVSHGWLLVNIWHNAQYLMIVWFFNATRFRDGIDPHHAFLSTISQPRNVLLFLAVCLGLSAALYLPLRYVVPAAVSGLPVALVLSQILNFHHYVVDARVWRLRQAPVRAGLGLA